jgi:hypothetical protein
MKRLVLRLKISGAVLQHSYMISWRVQGPLYLHKVRGITILKSWIEIKHLLESRVLSVFSWPYSLQDLSAKKSFKFSGMWDLENYKRPLKCNLLVYVIV